MKTMICGAICMLAALAWLGLGIGYMIANTDSPRGLICLVGSSVISSLVIMKD